MRALKAATLSGASVVILVACSSPPSARPSGEPRRVLVAFVEAWNRHDLAAIDTLAASDAVHEDMALEFRGTGPAEFKAFMQQTYGMIPDFDWRLTEVLVDGARAAAEWNLAGTYSGDTPAGPVKGKRFSIRGASIVTTEGGKIKRFTDYYTLTDFYRQVGPGESGQ
jgi:steroid delta-isomerase-like uncharacterized protein